MTAQAVRAIESAWEVVSAHAGEGRSVQRMHKVMRAAGTGQQVLAVTIFPRPRADGEGEELVMQLALPHGLNLPEGVRIAIDDGEPVRHDIITADQNGAYAVIPLDEELLARLGEGKKLVALMKNMQGNEVRIEVSLEGFGEAAGKLEPAA